MTTRILVVDDQKSIADTLCEILCTVGYECTAVYSGADALEHFEKFPPALIITDVIMPDMNGIDLAKRVRAAYPDCAVLLSSGNANTQHLMDAERLDGPALRVLAKPVPPRELLEVVAGILSQRQ
jgi:CheY-like chemotaxis protein